MLRSRCRQLRRRRRPVGTHGPRELLSARDARPRATRATTAPNVRKSRGYRSGLRCRCEAREERAGQDATAVLSRPSLTLSELLKYFPLVSTPENSELEEGRNGGDVLVESLSNDSRNLGPNCVFFCIEGTVHDGHDFAAQAAASGAIAVVASKKVDIDEGSRVPVILVEDTQRSLAMASKVFYGDPSARMDAFAVTGTNGKTTTTWLIRGILEEFGQITGMIGTVEYALAEHRLDSSGQLWATDEDDPTLQMQQTLPAHIVPYLGKYEVENTTPDCLQVQKIMSSMVNQGGEAVVMEASSHALAMGRCDNIDVNVGVFTNLSRDHMDFHRTMDAYLKAKLRLFDLISSDGCGVVNLDDPASQTFLEAAARRGLRVLTFSSDPSSDANVVCVGADLSLFKTEMVVGVAETGDQVEITSTLLGRANVSNILAAVTAGLAMGYPADIIAAGIESTDFVPGRYELINEGQDFAVLVDYAHTPDALANVLDDARAMGAKRVITVFGCGGSRDRGKRPLMGKIAHDKSDIVFVTSDNPRTENPDVVIDDIVSGFSKEVYEEFDVDRELGLHWLQDIHNLDPVFIPDKTTRRWEKFKYIGNRSRAQHLQNSVRRYVVQERYYAIRLAIGMAEPGDCVVIAGKGHEDYQILMDDAYAPVKSWFDDRVESYAALQEMAKIQAAGWRTSELPWTWGKPELPIDPDDIE